MGVIGFNVANALRATFLTADTFGQAFTGIRWYPDVPIYEIGGRWGDHFGRGALSQSGGYVIWNNFGGTLGFTTGTPRGSSVRMTTGAVIGNDSDLASDSIAAYRTMNSITTVRATIRATLVQTADTEVFLGLHDRTVNQAGAITALPTTARHAGFILDASVSANWRRSTADGTTQSVTSSTTAADTSIHNFVITWTSGNVNFDIDTTDIGSNTANLPADTDTLAPTLFIQTEAAAAKIMDIDSVILEFA